MSKKDLESKHICDSETDSDCEFKEKPIALYGAVKAPAVKKPKPPPKPIKYIHKCPKCLILHEKAENKKGSACSHMYCYNCHYEWCATCGLPDTMLSSHLTFNKHEIM